MMQSDATKKPKLLDEVRAQIRRRGLAYYTERSYIGWIRRFILFHDKQHPKDLSTTAIAAFLNYLAVERNVSPSTQNQALNSLVFLYREVLGFDLGTLEGILWSKKPKLLPEVLSREEIAMTFSHLDGIPLLVSKLMYGCGLRLIEVLRLRIEDIDFVRYQIQIRDAKGSKDRVVMLPELVKSDLELQISAARKSYELCMKDDQFRVSLPHALDRKFRNLSR